MTAALAQLEPLDLLARYGVTFLRVSGTLMFLPVFGSMQIPVRVRVVLGVVLAIALAPLMPTVPELPGTWIGFALLGLREITIGAVFGLAARTLFSAVENAAGIIAGQSGFAMASMVDPLTGDQGLVTTLFANVLTLALFLAADLHHLLILALRDSFALIPPAATLPALSALGPAVPELGVRMFVVTVELAGPALIVTIGVDLLLAFVGRAMAQVPILIVGYPLKLAAGMVALALLAVTTGTAIGTIGRTIAADGRAVMASLAGDR